MLEKVKDAEHNYPRHGQAQVEGNVKTFVHTICLIANGNSENKHSFTY